MNILLITNEFYPITGGVSNTLWNFYNYMKNKNHNLYIINPYYSARNVFKFRRMDPHYSSNYFSKIFNFLYNFKNLYFFLRKIKFDIILAGDSNLEVIALSLAFSRIFKKKLVSMAYGSDFMLRKFVILKTYYFHKSNKIIVISNNMKDIIKKIHHLKDNKVCVINVGINPQELLIDKSKEELRKEFNIIEEEFILISVGRQVIRKNFDLVIRAVNIIKKEHPSLNLKYFLIGEGPESSNLKKLTEELNLQNNVRFLGFCDVKTRNKYYKLSDLFLMPSVTLKKEIEGFGIVFLEANYYKIPVIGSSTGGMVDAVKNGKTGFLIRPNDLNDLVEKILYFFNNKEKRIMMGEIGHNRVLNEFNWNFIVSQYIQEFQDVLNLK